MLYFDEKEGVLFKKWWIPFVNELKRVEIILHRNKLRESVPVGAFSRSLLFVTYDLSSSWLSFALPAEDQVEEQG